MTRPATTPPRRILGWHIQATCPRCGSQLGHIADGNPTPWYARAIACGVGLHTANLLDQLTGPRRR